MRKGFILSPEELYYMGGVFQAKYIDYAYIAAMNDIRENYSLYEKETKASLVASGLLMEDFSGNIEVDAEAKDAFKPIFFGEIETSIDVCSLGEKNTVDVYKFHFYDGAITLVTGENGKLLIRAIDQITIRDIIGGLLPDTYNAQTQTIDSIDKSAITRLIAVKSVVVGQGSVVKIYIESNGIVHQENGEYIESISRETFISDVYSIVKGE